MNEQQPIADRVSSEYNALIQLHRTHPRLFWILLFVATVMLVFIIYDRIWGIPKLQQTISDQKQQIMLLETQLAPFKTIALDRYPGVVTESLDRLANDLETLQKKLIDATTSIKSLDAIASIKVSADWKDGKPPDLTNIIWFGGGTKSLSVKFELENGSDIDAVFDGHGGLHIETVNGNVVTIQYQANAVPGSSVFGRKPTDIVALKQVGFIPFGVNSNSVTSKMIKIEHLAIRFFTNGAESFECNIAGSGPVDVTKTGNTASPWLVWKGREIVANRQEALTN